MKLILLAATVFYMAQADYLKAVKAGTLSYKNEVGPRLEAEMDALEALTRQSTLPESVDREYWDCFVAGVMLAETKEAK